MAVICIHIYIYYCHIYKYGSNMYTFNERVKGKLLTLTVLIPLQSHYTLSFLPENCTAFMKKRGNSAVGGRRE